MDTSFQPRNFDIRSLLPSLSEPIEGLAAIWNADTATIALNVMAAATGFFQSEIVLQALLSYPSGAVIAHPAIWVFNVVEAGFDSGEFDEDTGCSVLHVRQQKENEEHRQRVKDYQVEHFKWESKTQRVLGTHFFEPEPRPPIRCRYFCNGGTPKELFYSLPVCRGSHPIAVRFPSLLPFLGFYEPIHEARTDLIRFFWDAQAISISGSIQQDKLKILLGSFPELDVFSIYSKVLYSQIKESPTRQRIAFDSSPIDRALKQIEAISSGFRFRFALDAEEAYKSYKTYCNLSVSKEPNKFFRLFIQRMHENIARVCLIAHCLEYAAQGKVAPLEVPADTLSSAIDLVESSFLQARDIFAEVGTP